MHWRTTLDQNSIQNYKLFIASRKIIARDWNYKISDVYQVNLAIYCVTDELQSRLIIPTSAGRELLRVSYSANPNVHLSYLAS
jgi:hypothetical protein